MTRGLLDTSVFIARESGRPVDHAKLPDEAFVSVVTLAELQAGVLAAQGTDVRARRLRTLEALAAYDPLVVGPAAAAEWARMRVLLAGSRRKVNVNDLWIAAVAAANGLPVVTQDDDFDVIEDVGGPAVVKI
ncbi:MAG: type II toxin-antitoxin system VapC family toxin [Nocardioides sp.]|uniref:type II toxin-antitoxin system VapC family toxin n=1 Tax=Nocardioides sp. TaxID=35761 RepID=UPI0039E6EB81